MKTSFSRAALFKSAYALSSSIRGYGELTTSYNARLDGTAHGNFSWSKLWFFKEEITRWRRQIKRGLCAEWWMARRACQWRLTTRTTSETIKQRLISLWALFNFGPFFAITILFILTSRDKLDDVVMPSLLVSSNAYHRQNMLNLMQQIIPPKANSRWPFLPSKHTLDFTILIIRLLSV